MCGIFGAYNPDGVSRKTLSNLVKSAERRGLDSSGLVTLGPSGYRVARADFRLSRLIQEVTSIKHEFVMGHARLVTSGMTDNQPITRGPICVLHNGILLDVEETWKRLGLERELVVDSELIAAIAERYLIQHGTLDGVGSALSLELHGAMSCVLLNGKGGELVLFSNTGSLFLGKLSSGFAFASERAPLARVGCVDLEQLTPGTELLLRLPQAQIDVTKNHAVSRSDLAPQVLISDFEDALLEYRVPEFQRCSVCILPETMPFITFDRFGRCNYCSNYKSKLITKPLETLETLVEPFRRNTGPEVVVPFSGGRDSSFALHIIVKALGLKAVTYTYDWGMVTDLGRRNISLMSSELGIENIVVAADVSKKRRNIRDNLVAWLRSPHLGMLSVLTAGDKHFFKHVESVKRDTGTTLNIWGVNPLETTHFKSGFLGIAPDFSQKGVYSTGLSKQLSYHRRRFGAMLESPGYFNLSLWDTLSGEFFRSFSGKSDYHHLFDYWQWDESEIEETLIGDYGWETSNDTRTTWRIGDGTAGFYNYAYYTIAGFSEHDTFRSNQIREGSITRDEALVLVSEENRPRYENIKWYLSTLGLDFSRVIKTVNSAPRLY